MQLSKTTVDLLATLDTFSGRKLTRREDLGALIELATLSNRQTELNNLSFFAKFISKTIGIMKRIGKNGEGYDKLEHEFTEAIEKSRALLTTLLAPAPSATRQHFSNQYLVLTPDALQNLLSLCYDLSWYKNWMIDQRA